MPLAQLGKESELPPYAVEFLDGTRVLMGEGPPLFTLLLTDEAQYRRFLHSSEYSVAQGFIRSEFDIEGDLVAALRLKQAYRQSAAANWLHTLFSRCVSWVPAAVRRPPASGEAGCHYDRSDEFFSTFLDARLVYSEPHVHSPEWSLEWAQEAKLQSICEDLALRAEERFLDVACGWGALVIHAAERFGVRATGCALSHAQCEFANSAIAARGLEGIASVRESDYRGLSESFDKIASVGMFEHIGPYRLSKYFRKMYGLLEDSGLFLFSDITRPESGSAPPQFRFFPAGLFSSREPLRLSEILEQAADVGFRAADVRSVRDHYARTCRAWVDRLQKIEQSCLNLVGQETYRTWLLYLAASALAFETGQTDVQRIVFRK